MKKTATHKRLLSLLMAAVMILSMLPVFQREVSAESTVLLNETVDLAASAAAKDTYWEVDFEAGKTYTITAQWASSPKFSGSGTTVATAWKLSTVPSNTVQSGGDVIFWASLKPSSSVYAAKGYQAVFTPTQDMPYLDFYYQNFGAEANSFTIKVEEGNTLNTTIAADQELVYDSYITAAGGTTYLNAYIGLPLQAGTTYNVTASHPSAPGYTDAGTGSGWKVVTAPAGNTENQGENIITVLRNEGATALTSKTATFTPGTTHPFLNFFTQKCDSNDRTIHITVTKDKTIVPGEDELAISILGDSISTYTDISSGAAASTTNSTIGNNEVYYTAGRFGVYQADTWWQQAADALGAKVLVNNAWSGSCVYQERSGAVGAYVDRCVQLHDDTGANAGEKPDIIAVYLGTNDYRLYPDTLGTVAGISSSLITQNGSGYTYAAPTTTAEAYDIVLHKITQAYPDAEIYCFTVLNRTGLTTAEAANLSAMNDIIRSLAQKYSATLVDLYNDSGIGDNDFFQTYIPNDSGNLVHPGPNGMDAITNCFLSAVYANSANDDIDNGTTYSVSYDLTDAAVKQGTAKTVLGGKAFTCDLITKTGYTMDVKVTMGGTDITSTAYANGAISVDSVSGDIVIKAEGKAAPAAAPQLNTPVTVAQGTSTINYDYTFEAGKAYKVTATWASDPSFPTGQKGWSLTTGTTAADGDLVVLANTGKTYGAKVAKSATVIFTATEDASKLYLNTAGITEDNSLTVTVEPATAEAGLVVDLTVTLPAGTRYTNVYTGTAFTSGVEYDYSVQWSNQPTHTTNNVRAWKIQTVSSTAVDGAGDGWYVGPKSASGVSEQTASGTITDAATSSVFNLFTQYLQDENTVHITIKKPVVNLEETSTLTTAATSKTYAYKFTAGKAYKVTATWASDPSFPSGQKGWSLTTGTTSADGDLVVLANTGITYGAKVAKSATVIFTATKDATNLYLDAAGITADNTVTITVEPATAEADTLVDLTVTLPAGTRYTNVYTDAAFTANEKYDYSAQWTSQPTHSADGVRAWKLQSVPNSSVDGKGDMFYGPYSGSGVSPQSASGTYTATATNSVFNLFTQQLTDENTLHITVKKAENTVVQLPYDILDEVSIAKSYSVAGNANGLCGKAGCTEGHPMQSFDVYDGILFVSYDAGYVITYDLETGAKLSGFLMGCGEYSHDHHCGNCMFGTAKFDPNDRFPLLYSSGDLSTKDCYVERILTDSNGIPIGSEMIQRIDFDMGEFAGANGAQAVVDPANNRIIFQQREKSSISELDSAFVMGEYPLPAHTEGTLQPDGSLLVEYDTGDFLVPAYKLPYWSPMYQGADYFENLFLQTHGPTINGFGSGNGVMVFDYNTPGHDFTRYIAMGPVVGVHEPQGVSVCDGKLYMSYGGAVHELAVKLGVKETGYDLATATDAAGIKTFVETEVTKQLTDGGKGYTLKNVEVKSITATGFAADVTVKTPYTIQTFAVSGNMNVPTTDIPAGNSTTYFDQTFKAGKAYIVTLDWTDVPSFTGSQAGYTLQTTDKQNAGDLVLTTMNKIAGDTSKAVSLYSGLFIPTKDMTALELKVTGMDAANKAVVTVVETTAEDDILFDGTVSLEGGAGFTNSFFPVEFVTGERYAVTATWKDQPTYGGVSTAWKVQPATSTTLEGNSDQRFAWVKTTDGDAALKGYSGNVTAAMDGDYLNVFTQGLTAANEMHVTVKKLPAADADTDAFVASQLGQETAVADNKSNVFAYNFQAGKAYKVTATWKNTPAFSGSDGGWNLRAIGSATSDDTRELVFKAMTDGSDSAVLPKSFVGTFRPTQDLSHLKLATQGLTGNDNAITVTVEEVTLPETTVFEGKLSVESNQKRLDAYAGLDFDGDKNYKVTVAFDDEIVHYSNAYATAWGMQLAGSEYLTSAKADAYVTETSANNVGSRGFTYVFDPAEDISTFHFFLNKVKNANNVSIKIEETSEPQTGTVVPDFIRDSVTITKLPVTGGGQGFDIWNGVMFQCQDAGYCKTYDLATGAQLGSFALGSQYSHNHCGNANFGTQYPTGNTEYPALYVSGDLTTKACYVENVTETSSELIQTIYFDIDPSYTGGQVILDRERNVLLYQQRQQPGIRDSLNYFKVYEFPVPKLSDGAEIRYDNDDVLKAYDLYFTTLYQGATLQNGLLLQTHGPCANAFNSSVGVMAFNVEKGVPERHIDLTSLKYEEPQGITVYDNRLIMSFADGSYYQIELNMNFKQTGYVIPCAANEAALKEAIAKAVEAELEKDAKTKGFTVAEVKLTTSTRAAGFTAEVTVETAYTNHQTYTVSGTVGEHSFTNYVSNGNATCTADGTKTATCDNGCGLTDTVTDVGSKGHKLEKVAYKAPTTQAEGNIEHYACQGCGKLYNDDKATKELTKAETVLERLPEPTTESTTAPTTEPTTAPTTTPTTAPTTPATGEGYPIALMVWLMLGSVLALVVTMKRRSV